MKKIMIISLVVIACVAMAAPVFAEHTFNGNIAAPVTAAVTTIFAGASFAPSTGVYVSATSDANGTAYTVQAVHDGSIGSASGKVYGARNIDTTIRYIMNPTSLTTYKTNSATVLNPATGWTSSYSGSFPADTIRETTKGID